MPRYPDDAKQRGVGGVVTLDAIVDASGNVAEVKVIRSIPMLEASAVTAVKQWRYPARPPARPGAPASTPIRVVFLFDGSTGRVDEARRIDPQGPQPRKTKQMLPTRPASVGDRTGRVVLDVVVNASGKVVDMRVVNATSGFENAARDAVRQWEYAPLMVNGSAVPFVASVTVLFSTR